MKNTLVIFGSDNGSPARSGVGYMGEIGTVTELYSHVPNAPWRGLKADAWEAGHRVPFIVRWDGRIAPGSLSSAAICLTDIFATVAEITGFQVANGAGEDSFSLMPLLTPESGRLYERRSIVHSSLTGVFAIRQGAWKLILGDGSGGFSQPRGKKVAPGGDGAMQLYNLKADPQERDNLIHRRPDRRLQLMNELVRIVNE